MNSATTVLTSAVHLSVPLSFAACGEYVAERAGTLNISVEAMMLSGAYAGAIGSSVTHNAGIGLVWGAAIGFVIGAIHGNLSHRLHTNTFVVGITLNVLALGLTSYLLNAIDMQPRQVGVLTIPVLSHIPIVGRPLFSERWPFFLLYALVPFVWWIMQRRRWGLELRSVGENPAAADVNGIDVNRRRRQALLWCGAASGFGGATLSIGEVGTFNSNMTAGRGFIVIAAVIFGGWTLRGTIAGCFVFGGADALRLALPALGYTLNPQLLIAAPYLLALIVMLFFAARARQPAALAQPFDRGGRAVKAAVQRAHGGVEELTIETVDDPVPGPHDVLVAVRATALNRLDVLQRIGPPLVPGFTLPHIAGTDVAGDVVALGAEVDAVALHARVLVNPAVPCGVCAYCRAGEDRFCSDPRVVGGNRPGGYAELTTVPATHVHPIPEGVGFAEAAAIPTTWTTAWKGLLGTGRLQRGETVVIHAAGSGVSVAAIQIAKSIGATVIATAGSDDKLARAAKLGADVMINNRRDDIAAATLDATGGSGADMVFDHVGPARFQASLFSLRPRGRMVFCGTTTGPEATFNLGHAYHSGLALLGVEPFSVAEFAEVLDFYWSGDFDPVIDSELPLERVREAQTRMEQGALFGKIVLHP